MLLGAELFFRLLTKGKTDLSVTLNKLFNCTQQCHYEEEQKKKKLSHTTVTSVRIFSMQTFFSVNRLRLVIFFGLVT